MIFSDGEPNLSSESFTIQTWLLSKVMFWTHLDTRHLSKSMTSSFTWQPLSVIQPVKKVRFSGSINYSISAGVFLNTTLKLPPMKVLIQPYLNFRAWAGPCPQSNLCRTIGRMDETRTTCHLRLHRFLLWCCRRHLLWRYSMQSRLSLWWNQTRWWNCCPQEG